MALNLHNFRSLRIEMGLKMSLKTLHCEGCLDIMG